MWHHQLASCSVEQISLPNLAVTYTINVVSFIPGLVEHHSTLFSSSYYIFHDSQVTFWNLSSRLSFTLYIQANSTHSQDIMGFLGISVPQRKISDTYEGNEPVSWNNSLATRANSNQFSRHVPQLYCTCAALLPVGESSYDLCFSLKFS